jgi:hypothetical protein
MWLSHSKALLCVGPVLWGKRTEPLARGDFVVRVALRAAQYVSAWQYLAGSLADDQPQHSHLTISDHTLM